MVTASPEQVRRDTQTVFEKPEIPEIFAFVQRLSPVNVRIFWAELRAMLVAVLNGVSTTADLIALIDAWDATADLDGDPELAAALRAPKSYRPVTV